MLRTRFLIPALFALLAFCATIAAAATLGGLNPTDLGADDADVVACNTDGVDLDYTTAYNATTRTFDVTSATVSAIDVACVGQELTVVLTDAGNAPLATGSVIVADVSQAVALDVPAAASAVVGASVLITG